MGDTVEEQPADGPLPAERLAPEQPSTAVNTGQQPKPAPHRPAYDSSLDISSELGVDTFSLLFPPSRPVAPASPAATPGDERATSAPPDGDTGQASSGRARPAHPLSALDIETQRISLARRSGDATVERPASTRPAIETETQRLPPRSAVTDAQPPQASPQDGVSDAETYRLPPKEGIADAETLRLAPATPTLAADTGLFAPSGPDGGPDYTLPRPITPETLSARHSLGWSEEDEVALEDALQREASAALAALSEMLGGAPAAPDVAPATPEAAPSPAPDEPGDETLAVVRALRVNIRERASLRNRVLALLAQPSIIVMTLFAIAQMALLPFWGARVASDEISSFQAGLRMVQGYSSSGEVQGLARLAGALLWLAVASAGYLAAGLTGARLIAVVCVVAAGLATAGAAKNLFGQTAGLFTALAFSLCGPVIYLAHLAVPDQLALVGVAVSFWALTQASASRRSRWLIVAACAWVVGVIAWLPALLCLISLIGVTLALRARPLYTGLYIAGLIVVAVVMSRVLPAHESILTIIPQRSRTGLSLSFSVSAVALELLYDGVVVWGLAIAGWVAARWRGRLGAALVAGMLVWPAYLALAGGGADIERWLVFGFVFGLPLVGAAIAALWNSNTRSDVLRRARVVVLLVAIGISGAAQAWAYGGGSGFAAPHAIHVVAGKADAGAPPTPHAPNAPFHVS